MYEDQINRALGVYEHKNNVREHFYCVKEMFDLYKTKGQLLLTLFKVSCVRENIHNINVDSD